MTTTAKILVLISMNWLTVVGADLIGIEDFGVGARTTTFNDLPFASLQNEAPLEIDGHTITTDDGIFRYSDFSPWNLCIAFECISTNTDLGFIDILLDGTNVRAGAWVSSRITNWQFEVSFYDSSDALLGSVSRTGTDMPLFIGWESMNGIGRMRIQDLTENNRTTVVDNLIVEKVPVPTAIWLFAGAIGVLSFLTRRR